MINNRICVICQSFYAVENMVFPAVLLVHVYAVVLIVRLMVCYSSSGAFFTTISSCYYE